MVQVRVLALIAVAGVVVAGCDFGTQVTAEASSPGNARIFKSIYDSRENKASTGHAQPFAGPQVKGAGPIKSEDRTIGSFNLIDVGANFTVDVQVGPRASMKVSAQQNLLKHITAKIKNSVLEITYNVENISTDKPVHVTLTTPQLNGVDVSGAAQMKVKGLNASKFVVDASGASKLQLAGKATDLFVDSSGAAQFDYDGFKGRQLEADVSGASQVKLTGSSTDVKLELSGAGQFKGENLSIEKAVVNASGAGNAFVNVRGMLKVRADGGSNVRYKGGAKTDIEADGAASVSKA